MIGIFMVLQYTSQNTMISYYYGTFPKKQIFDRNRLFQSILLWRRHMQYVTIICQCSQTATHRCQRLKHSNHQPFTCFIQFLKEWHITTPSSSWWSRHPFPENTSDELTLVSSHAMRRCGSLWAHSIVELSTCSTSVCFSLESETISKL